AAQRFDVFAHDVHADAAAGNVRDFFRGRKTGRENQVQDFALVQFGIGGDQAAFDGFVANAVGVHAAAVVGDFDDDAAGFLERSEAQRAVVGLAGGAAAFDILDAVVHGVAHAIHQRVGEFFHHRFVEFGIG